MYICIYCDIGLSAIEKRTVSDSGMHDKVFNQHIASVVRCEQA
jgi:hypothetical protein